MQEDVPLYRSRFPGYDVLAKAHEWDEVTRRVVLERVSSPPPIRFFRPHERETLQALFDTVLPQDDRPEGERVPILNFLDERLHARRGPGYRYHDVPPDPEMWRALVPALDDEARLGWRAEGFAALHPQERARLVGALMAGEARSPGWAKLPPRRVLGLVVAEAVTHYYGHPLGWSEIGFGGPKFPGIYARTLRDNPDEAQASASSSPRARGPDEAQEAGRP
jgi:hypothetical protein